jgi:hypothetical protein
MIHSRTSQSFEVLFPERKQRRIVPCVTREARRLIAPGSTPLFHRT